MKLRTSLLFLSFVALVSSAIAIAFVCSVSAQRSYRLTRPCAASTTSGLVEIERDGDINLRPCSGRDVNINGTPTVNTITFSGSSRTNFFPYFTTNTNLTKSPFSWDGTSYAWNNTAVTSDFVMNLNPTTGVGGSFLVGDSTSGTQDYFSITSGQNDWHSSGNLDIGTLGGAAIGLTSGGGGTISLTSGSNTQIRNSTTAGATFAAATGLVTVGDLTGVGSQLTIDDNGGAQLFGATEAILGGSGTGIRAIVATDTLRSTLATWDTSAAGGVGYGVTSFLLNRTITAGGTTGDQTINLPAGTVNFAAGTGTAGITVTNSTVSATSIIMAIARTNDATCSVKNVVAASGSFVIRMDANCTAETSVGFIVTN